MDQQQPDEPVAPSATRSQNVVYTFPQDWGFIPQFLAPALERLDRDTAAGTQLLVVTPDAETALATADAALTLRDDAGRPALVPVTRAERVARLARGGAPSAIAGAPDALAALVRSSALKLDAVRTVIFAWADAILDSRAAAELETVLAELPKDAARVLVAAETTPEVEALIERHLRRPRRIAPAGAAAPGAPAPRAVTVAYVPVTAAARPAALRRVIDELDPPSAAVVVTSDASQAEARRTLRALGYAGDAAGGSAGDDDAAGLAQAGAGADLRVVRADAGPLAQNVALVVLYDVPADRAVIDRVAGAQPGQIVVLAQPRQLEGLRALTGGVVTPLALPDHGRAARARDEGIRAELRTVLTAGVPHRELVALEPLLDEFDGVQVAAAALLLLERDRARLQRTATAPNAAGAPAAGGGDASGMTRLFVTVGSKDGVRPGDLVGAIASEGGISSDRIGKIEVRDAFSLVEVASADASRVIERVNGISIRGRRATVRQERDRGAGGERGPRAGGDRGGDRGERRAPAGDRRGPDRRGPGTERRGPGGPGGGRGFDTRRDGPRGFGAADDRGVRERAEQRDEWAARAERLRRSRRDVGPAGAEGEADAPDRASGMDPMDQDES